MDQKSALIPTFEEIKEMAEIISRWHDTFDEFVWLMAEAELKIQLGEQPKSEAIAKLAESIANKRPTLQELHWFLAERYLYLLKKEQQEENQ